MCVSALVQYQVEGKLSVYSEMNDFCRENKKQIYYYYCYGTYWYTVRNTLCMIMIMLVILDVVGSVT